MGFGAPNSVLKSTNSIIASQSNSTLLTNLRCYLAQSKSANMASKMGTTIGFEYDL